MHTDLTTKPDFTQLNGQDLVRYNNAMVREILETGLTGYREVTIFQNKEAGIKRCEANWSSLVCGRANVAAEAKERGDHQGSHELAESAKRERGQGAGLSVQGESE